jgi:hypothetical protein
MGQLASLVEFSILEGRFSILDWLLHGAARFARVGDLVEEIWKWKNNPRKFG